jgi:hypothetical protein
MNGTSNPTTFGSVKIIERASLNSQRYNWVLTVNDLFTIGIHPIDSSQKDFFLSRLWTTDISQPRMAVGKAYEHLMLTT